MKSSKLLVMAMAAVFSVLMLLAGCGKTGGLNSDMSKAIKEKVEMDLKEALMWGKVTVLGVEKISYAPCKNKVNMTNPSTGVEEQMPAFNIKARGYVDYKSSINPSGTRCVDIESLYACYEDVNGKTVCDNTEGRKSKISRFDGTLPDKIETKFEKFTIM